MEPKKERTPRKLKKSSIGRNYRRWCNGLKKVSKRLGYFRMSFKDAADNYREYYDDGFTPEQTVWEDWSCM